MQKYAVIVNLEEARPKHKLSDLPLHLTLLGVFSSDKSSEYFVPILKDAAQNYGASTTKTMGCQNFGNNERSIMVTELKKTKELNNLQRILVKSFGNELNTMDKNFQPTTYRPHVTDQNNRSLAREESVTIDNLTLVEIDGDNVFERFRLSLDIDQ